MRIVGKPFQINSKVVMFELTILTENDDIKTICELYWEMNTDLEFMHKVSEIADLLKIEKSKILSIVRENSLARQLNWKCEDCSAPYVFSSRTDLRTKRDKLNKSCTFVCDTCQKRRRQSELEARRKKEEAERRKLEERNRELRKQIRKIYDLENRLNVDVNNLSLRDIVYLISMLRAGAFEGMTKIMPLAMFDQPLSPTLDYSTAIVKHLANKKLIYVHPDNEPDAFHEGDPNTYYIWHVYYAPPISLDHIDDPNYIVREALRRVNDEWPSDWYKAAYKIWRRIALEECIEYLLYVLSEHHFEFSPGKKTIQYIEYALENFSTAQIFNIIWRSTKDAAAYYQRESISKRQAANSAISSIQRYAERAISEGWELKPYGRNFNCKQSVISEVLYNTLLRFGDNGFRLVPSLEAVENKDEPEEKQSQYTLYHSQDLVEKWNFDPDKVLGEYGANKSASDAQLQFIQSLASQFPDEAQELEMVINSTTADRPFALSDCTNGQAKWLIRTFLSLQDKDREQGNQ